jgi:hypothetical protein
MLRGTAPNPHLFWSTSEVLRSWQEQAGSERQKASLREMEWIKDFTARTGED